MAEIGNHLRDHRDDVGQRADRRERERLPLVGME